MSPFFRKQIVASLQKTPPEKDLSGKYQAISTSLDRIESTVKKIKNWPTLLHLPSTGSWAFFPRPDGSCARPY